MLHENKIHAIHSIESSVISKRKEKVQLRAKRGNSL